MNEGEFQTRVDRQQVMLFDGWTYTPLDLADLANRPDEDLADAFLSAPEL